MTMNERWPEVNLPKFSVREDEQAVARAGMPRWRQAQAALNPGRKLEVIGKLILQTRHLDSIKRHATRL